MPRYIDVDALIKVGEAATMVDVFPDWLNMSIAEKEAACKHGRFLRNLIQQLPTVDAKPVVHGTWLYNRINSPDFRICDKCGCPYRISKIESKYNYCPNCGAKMDGDGDG